MKRKTKYKILKNIALSFAMSSLLFSNMFFFNVAQAVILPSTIYLSSTTSAQITTTVSDQIVTAAPASSNTTTSVKEAKSTTYFQWQPTIAGNTTASASAPTSPNGKGFIYDTALNSTIPTGTWTFNVETKNSTTSSTAVGHVVVCAWSVTLSAGSINLSSQIFSCQEGATNIVGNNSTALTASSVSVSSVAAQSFDGSHFLYVEYWLRVTTATGSTTFTTSFEDNAGTKDDIVLPGASANLAPNTPTLNSPANAATAVSTTPTMTMTANDPESNNIRYKILICSNSTCGTVVQTIDQNTSQTGWSGQNATCSAANDCYTSGTQGSFIVQTSLSANTQYWCETFAKDPSDSNTFSSASLIFSFTTAASQTLSFNISANSVGFGNLSTSASTYANSAGTGSTTEVEAHTLSASTNATNGYTISIQGATLTNNSNTITAIGSTAAAPSSGTNQFGLRINITSGTGTATAPYATTGQFAYAATATASSQIASGTGDGSSTIFSMRYLCNISSLTVAGPYTTNLTYTITANF